MLSTHYVHICGVHYTDALWLVTRTPYLYSCAKSQADVRAVGLVCEHNQSVGPTLQSFDSALTLDHAIVTETPTAIHSCFLSLHHALHLYQHSGNPRVLLRKGFRVPWVKHKGWVTTTALDPTPQQPHSVQLACDFLPVSVLAGED